MCIFFFFKQKTAYEMRISDWSSDVCSSDLVVGAVAGVARAREEGAEFVAITERAVHMPRAARNAGAGIDDARPLHLAREDRVAERQRGTVAVAEIAHGGEAGAQRLHPVRLGIERLRGGAERDFLELAGDAARVTCQMDMAVDETRSEEHTS